MQSSSAAAGALHRDQLPPEPRSYHEAMKLPTKERWQAAMDAELQSLYRKEAFTKVPKEQALGKQLILLK